MKRIKRNSLLIAIFGLFSLQIQAQTMKQRVADRLYDELSFFKAVEMYEDLAEKEDANAYLYRRTAECYRFLGDSKNSEIWYSKLVEDDASESEDYYHYAQMLKMNEKYEEANEMLAAFKAKVGSNSIAEAHAEKPDYVTELKSNPERYSIAIMNQKVNTEHSDFGPNYLTINGETKLTFTSARKNMALRNEDFQWDGSHFLDIYESNLGGDGESTGVEKFDKGVMSRYHEGPVSFSNNGTKLYLTRSNYLNKKKGLDTAKHNNLKLYLSEKGSDGEWSKLKEFEYNSDYYSLGHATVTEDGKTMYFSSDMPGGKGQTDIWKTTLDNESWTVPVNVEIVNTEGREMFPFIGKEGILYLSSDGHVGLGGLDLYRSTPSGESFSEPLNMGFPLNTNHDDFAMIIDKDEAEGYFSSSRIGDESYGDDDIYRFKNLEPFGPPKFIVKGCAIEQKTKNGIERTLIDLINNDTKEKVATMVANDGGCYEFKDIPEGNYIIKASKPNYIKISDYPFKTEQAVKGEITAANTMLKKIDCGLLCRIVNIETKEPIQGAKVVLKDKKTNEVKTLFTNENGEFNDDLANYECPGGQIDFDLTITKEGYIDKNINFKKTIEKAGIVSFEEDLGLFKPDMEVTKLCGIDELLYDLNKASIRPDAEIQLDKLVDCMLQNPEMIVEIGSHTDCRASQRYNKKLSERRAKSARKYVISRGIAPYRIFGKGYGETRLLNECACEPRNDSDCSEDEHQLNRRTEFRIVAGGERVENNSTDSF